MLGLTHLFSLCQQWAQQHVYPLCHPDRIGERVSRPIVNYLKGVVRSLRVVLAVETGGSWRLHCSHILRSQKKQTGAAKLEEGRAENSLRMLLQFQNRGDLRKDSLLGYPSFTKP